MIGKGRSPTQALHYYAIDGGTSANALVALATASAGIIPVDAPRHADILLICEPLSVRLASAVVASGRALPTTARVVIYRPPATPVFPDEVAGVALFPQAHACAMLTAEAVEAAWAAASPDPVNEAFAGPLTTIDLPPPPEIATELAVLSLGPLQPFTAGPARFWLICDGEQILECRVETGYAVQGLTTAMAAASWEEAAQLAEQLDPLAPLAGRLAFVRALEALSGVSPASATLVTRELALARERARNSLWWGTRCLRLLDQPAFAAEMATLAQEVTKATSVEPQTALAWVAPGASSLAIPLPVPAALVRRLQRLITQLRQDRWLKLRTMGIGPLAHGHLHALGIGGFVMDASMAGQGDVRGRLLTQLAAAQRALELPAPSSASPRSLANWHMPSGSGSGVAEGARGRLNVVVKSTGGAGPIEVTAILPSAALVPLIPHLLRGQKVADAASILASLDLVMAEVGP